MAEFLPPRRWPEIELAGWRITCSKTTNHVRIAIVSSLSHSFTDRTTKCPLISFFFFYRSRSRFPRALSSAHFLTFFPLSLSFSRSLSKTLLANAFHTFHTSYLSYERRSKGLHEIGFTIILHIIVDFCSFLHRIFSSTWKSFISKNYVSDAIFATKWKIIDNTWHSL